MSKTASYPGRAPIDAYGNGGFRFADMSHRGSILCLPHGVYAWDAVTAEDLQAADFGAVFEAVGSIGLLLFGTGESQLFPSLDLRKTFAENSIALEPMSTGAAARTYNVLLAEGRNVAAALIAVD